MIAIRKNIITLLFVSATISLQAQSTSSDSLSLSNILDNVMNNYPSLLKVENDLTAADAKTELTKTAYLPDVLFSAGYSRIGPVNSFPFNGYEVKLIPENQYNATLSVNQTIYDFGKTGANTTLDQNSREIVNLSAGQIKQKLSGAVMMNYYNICFLQEAIRIKNDQLKNLNEHLTFVQKKQETGSATRYDILTTKVRISTIENQKTDLLAALKVQMAQLNTFLGKPVNNTLTVKQAAFHDEFLPSVDSLLNTAYDNRYEMKIAKQKEAVSKSRLAAIKTQNNPTLNAFANGGFKNGYLNNQLADVGRMNFVVGVGLKVPLFDANRSKYLKIQANADLQGNQQETELARRSISNEVVECRANAESALKKVKQSELQLQQATEAYQLANVNYQAGVITNLDLLDSYTSLSESKLTLYKTRIDHTVSLLRLKVALGEEIYKK
ncbi:MAG: outer rane efflux protein [Bacteroidetes bacterium]|nr:outer rane efflux protein [Bacteroidota bacterium]